MLPAAAAATAAASSALPSSVAFFNMSAAVAPAGGPAGLLFEEQAVAYALQGVVNGKDDAFPSLYGRSPSQDPSFPFLG